MRTKIIVTILLLLFAAVVFLIINDFIKEQPASENIYEFSTKAFDTIGIGTEKYFESESFSPEIPDFYGIVTDENNNFYIAGRGAVLIYSPQFTLTKRITTGKDAYCICLDKELNIYLGMQGHIEIWDTAGNQVDSWSQYAENSILTSVAVVDSSVYVADAGAKVVLRYSLDGQLIKEIGRKDTLKGIPGFIIPSAYFDLLIGREQELWVVNPGRHEFEQFKPDGSLNSVWGEGSMTLEGFCGCCNPSHAAILSDGRFVTSEKGIVRVKIYKPDGSFDCLVAGPDKFDEGTTDLDITIDSNDRIVILDPFRKKVRIFSKK